LVSHIEEGTQAECVDNSVLRKHDSGEDCVMRSFIICTAHQILFKWANKEEWDGRDM